METKLDLGAGIVLFTELFHAGMSAKHINAPDVRFTNVETKLTTGTPLRLTLHAGAEIPLTEGSRTQAGSFFSPNVIYTRQGNASQINSVSIETASDTISWILAFPNFFVSFE